MFLFIALLLFQRYDVFACSQGGANSPPAVNQLNAESP
ncbi:hypothetical protein ACZ87_01719 [Candidatus Erwinia dacicola]|uniref:Uncharacterized protein n=1 Tax=Candidatus Erwinia dacicola TaxID=252393 RepID=A0A328TLQ5_9GAMM|nr:hypothetical protein ACZ87_01719 [Candidatus Erwinia dacicola]